MPEFNTDALYEKAKRGEKLSKEEMLWAVNRAGTLEREIPQQQNERNALQQRANQLQARKTQLETEIPQYEKRVKDMQQNIVGSRKTPLPGAPAGVVNSMEFVPERKVPSRFTHTIKQLNPFLSKRERTINRNEYEMGRDFAAMRENMRKENVPVSPAQARLMGETAVRTDAINAKNARTPVKSVQKQLAPQENSVLNSREAFKNDAFNRAQANVRNSRAWQEINRRNAR